jgi:Calx-beta domain
MTGSHRNRFTRIGMVMISFVILFIAGITFYQLTQLTNFIQAQTLPTLTLSNSNLTVSEGIGTATINVNISTAATELITVSYATANGTAVSGSSSDYIATNGTITFATGESAAKAINITINDDTAVENTESFLLQLSNAVSATLGTPSASLINISDNDGNPTATPIFADPLEPNNNFAEASEAIADAADLCNLTFYPPGDQDYFRWWGKAGITYIASTSNLDPALDTVLDVYDSNQSLIASNDDIAPGIFRSEVSFTANVDGYYYARATNKSPTDPISKLYCFGVDSSVSDTPTPPPGFPADADVCEFNSTIETACLMVTGETKSNMNFVPTVGSARDTDIYKMWIKPGIYYTCETIIPAGSAADTNMIFWDSNGNPFNPWLGNDDKVPGGLDFGSEVSYLATYTGWLFIVIGPVNEPPLAEAAQHEYDITCTAVESTPTPTPSPTTVFTGGTGGGFSATATPLPTVEFPTPFPTPTPIDFSQFFTPTPAPPPVVQFQPLPTSTPSGAGAQAATINVTLYYDSNNNFLPELTEGIMNAAVALYDNGTGQLISFGQTNETGVARFTAVNATGAIRVVVPFLNYSQVVLGESAEILVRVAPQPLPIGIP